MGRISKSIGYRWEADLVRWLKGLGWHAAKRNGTLYGNKDQGDIGGLPWVWQAKDLSQLGPKRLADIMDEVKQQAVHANKRYYGIAFKRRGHGTKEAFFIMPIAMAEYLMRLELENEVCDDGSS